MGDGQRCSTVCPDSAHRVEGGRAVDAVMTRCHDATCPAGQVDTTDNDKVKGEGGISSHPRRRGNNRYAKGVHLGGCGWM